MENNEVILNAAIQKLYAINRTQLKLANHWMRLKGLYEQQRYIEKLGNRVISDKEQLEVEAASTIQIWWRTILGRRNASMPNKENCSDFGSFVRMTSKHEFAEESICIGNCLDQGKSDSSEQDGNTANVQDSCCQSTPSITLTIPITEVEKNACESDERIEEKAAIKLQAWWRGTLFRRRMSSEHKERLLKCVMDIREAPCSEANPKDERRMPLNQRIERYLKGLLSLVLTERKAMAIRLNRLANRSHVCIECMISKNAFGVIIESFADFNRSEAHLYVIRPLCELIVKFLAYKPFVDSFVERYFDDLILVAVKLIHNNYRDSEVVKTLVDALTMLSSYDGFRDKLVAVNYDWYMRKFTQQFGRLKPKDPRCHAYKKLCKLNLLFSNDGK